MCGSVLNVRRQARAAHSPGGWACSSTHESAPQSEGRCLHWMSVAWQDEAGRERRPPAKARRQQHSGGAKQVRFCNCTLVQVCNSALAVAGPSSRGKCKDSRLSARQPESVSRAAAALPKKKPVQRDGLAHAEICGGEVTCSPQPSSQGSVPARQSSRAVRPIRESRVGRHRPDAGSGA